MDSEDPDEPESWFTVEGLTKKRVLSPSVFVAQVTGNSMEPTIPDKDCFLFTFETGASRNSRIVLAQKSDITVQDTGANGTANMY